MNNFILKVEIECYVFWLKNFIYVRYRCGKYGSVFKGGCICCSCEGI